MSTTNPIIPTVDENAESFNSVNDWKICTCQDKASRFTIIAFLSPPSLTSPAPGCPSKPGGPFLPVDPFSPFVPSSPLQPLTPSSPKSPFLPMGPLSPFSPGGPTPPVFPIGPMSPVSPLSPKEFAITSQNFRR